VHYFRVAYESSDEEKEYEEVVITVRVAPWEKRKVMVTRSVPPVVMADNVDGYLSDY